MCVCVCVCICVYVWAQQLYMDIRHQYRHTQVLLWSLWWWFGYSVFELILNYDTSLFFAIDPNKDYNGFVIAGSRVFGALACLLPTLCRSLLVWILPHTHTHTHTHTLHTIYILYTCISLCVCVCVFLRRVLVLKRFYLCIHITLSLCMYGVCVCMYVWMDTQKSYSPLIASIVSGVSGVCLLISSISMNIYVAYGCFALFYSLMSFLVSASSAEIAHKSVFVCVCVWE